MTRHTALLQRTLGATRVLRYPSGAALVTFFLLVISAELRASELEAPWLRGVAAVYSMLRETGTVSADSRPERFGAATPAGGDAPHLKRESFVALARANSIRGLLLEDRRQLDENMWSYVAQASRKQVDHLSRQWGDEGKCHARSAEQDVRHVESCNRCRSAYEAVTRSTTLHCTSEKVGYRLKPDMTEDQAITIPP